jgi:nucleotide-binding universal stress UspA family protein
MKKILVAMDFSDSSLNAFQHALSIAEKFKSDITLLWNETKDSIRHLGLKGGENVKTVAENKLKEIADKYNNQNISINYSLTVGTTYKEVVRVSKELDVDLIVVGHHGTHGVRRFFIGDNANKIIALAKCPVLTIRLHRTINQGLDKIVMAIDNTLETRQKVPITTDFAKRFGAEVHIIGIYSSSVSTMKMKVDSYVKQAYAGLRTKGIPVKTHFVKTTNISKTILNYANQVNANLIVTMVDTEFFTSDVFLGKQGQQLVNQSHIPVLSVHNKEIIKTRPGI